MDNQFSRRDFNVQFTRKDEQVALPEWTVRITLCLAPLFAHLIAGVPQVVYMHNIMPKWHDTLVLYNPTSIIWRYFAITERRLSTSNHHPSELAAINVFYWTDKGWDNSERRVRQGQALCVRCPPRARNRVFSAEGLKTFIVTIQGVAAVGALLPGSVLMPDTDQTTLVGVFLPLAVMGLLRLPAAYWLTDDHNILNMFEKTMDDRAQKGSSHTFAPLLHHRLSSNSSFSEINEADGPTHHRYRPSIIAVLVRLVYTLFLLFILGAALYNLIVNVVGGYRMSLTRFWMLCGYTLLLIGCLCMYIPRFLKKDAQSTCVPSANATWYKCYTCFLILLAVGCMIIAALETWKLPDGTYSTGQFFIERLECRWFDPYKPSFSSLCSIWEHAGWTQQRLCALTVSGIRTTGQ